jgi:hypothetical protein
MIITDVSNESHFQYSYLFTRSTQKLTNLNKILTLFFTDKDKVELEEVGGT